MPVWGAIAAAVALLAIVAIAAIPITKAPAATPVDRASSPGASPAADPEGPVVAFLGDSYTTGVGAGFDGSWATQAARAMGWRGQFFGAAGTGYIAPGSRGQGTYGERVGQVIAGEPDKVIVSGGCNDLYKDLATLPAAADRLLADLQAGLPDVEIVVVLPWCGANVPTDSTAIDKSLTAASTAAGVRLLDTGQPLSGRPELLLSDGDTPNEAGHEVLSGAFVTAYLVTG